MVNPRGPAVQDYPTESTAAAYIRRRGLPRVHCPSIELGTMYELQVLPQMVFAVESSLFE